jgi:hypothetical protein
MRPANQDHFTPPLLTEDEVEVGASSGATRRDWVLREIALLEEEKPLPPPDDPPPSGER